MTFLDLKNISERYIELINPSTPEKALTIGRVLGLKKGSRVIEFGCGYGEILSLWAERFGISGIGIDVREHACERARRKMAERGFTDRIEIVCGDGAKYPYEKQSFDVAACIGASFIWGGYRNTIRGMKDAIRADGKLAIGEPYWLNERVPPEFAQKEQSIHTENELLRIARAEGFDFEYAVRASHDDWDRYEADNWRGLIHWIEENPDHPERQQVIDHLHESQDEYLRYGREYLGWAMYVLNPVRY
jgi:cyclopropane fatty-acyl-phospholipid synthase-like methyltransferase